MARPALDLYEVLEQEYVSMYGALEVPQGIRTGSIFADDILDFASACRTARPYVAGNFTERAELAAALDALVRNTDGSTPGIFASAPEISPTTELLIRDYDDFDGDVRPLVNRQIIDDVFAGSLRSFRAERLANVYSNLHQRARHNADEARSALCISGGGIRSATFALGVIQGLASARILQKFDYLSTVSGGGYIGSWLSSWIRRDTKGVAGVEASLYHTDSATGHTRTVTEKVAPEPPPVQHLREYSNYLAPRLGLMSADTWTVGALYLRNLLLNWLVLIPILAAALTLPRAFAWAVMNVDAADLSPLLWVNFGAGLIGYAMLVIARPVRFGPAHGFLQRMFERLLRRFSCDTRFFIGILSPLLVMSMAMALAWAAVAGHEDATYAAIVILAAYAAASVVAPAFVYLFRYLTTPFSARRERAVVVTRFRWHLGKIVSEAIAAGVAFVVGGLLLILLALKVFPSPTSGVPLTEWLPPFLRAGMPTQTVAALYVCFAVPLIMVVLFIQASIFVGIASRFNHDYDREWWGRAGGWLLIVAGAWAAISVIAVYGPLAIYNAPVLIASAGGVTGLISILLGRSAATPANLKQKGEAGLGAKVSNFALGLAVPFFVVFLLAGISWATTEVVQAVAGPRAPAAAWEFRAQFQAKAAVDTGVPGVTIETARQPMVSPYALAGLAHLRTVLSTSLTQLNAFLLLLAAGLALSLVVGVNRFSMHAMYRNRLIRAYLGASRYTRDPEGFTGFDPHDNIAMSDLRPELLWANGFRDVDGFVALLDDPNAADDQKKLAAELQKQFLGRTRSLLKGHRKQGGHVSTDLAVALFQEINRCIDGPDLGAAIGREPAPRGPGYPALSVVNRRLLEDVFPGHFVKMAGEKATSSPANDAAELYRIAGDILESDVTSAQPHDIPARAPLHVVNMALNLVGGDKLAWQQRKAESFTCTPLHSGSPHLGYRNSATYGEGISLGTACTISGAAASPNMGYHSSPALAFLLTVFNVRLGWWLGNPGPAGEACYRAANPDTTIGPLLREALGRTNDEYRWVYLSDGGHFENLGLYEMVLRRSHHIVVSDAGCDPKYAFDDLGNAIRKIRTDLGVPIEIEKMYMYPRGEEKQGKYCAVGRIRYSAVDGRNAVDGKLVYIKPGMYQEEWFPKDVYNYAQDSEAFPHETTADQFFSESQFESYRALGRHVINEICCNNERPAGADARMPVTRQFRSVATFTKFVEEQLLQPPTLVAETKGLLSRWMGLSPDDAASVRQAIGEGASRGESGQEKPKPAQQ